MCLHFLTSVTVLFAQSIYLLRSFNTLANISKYSASQILAHICKITRNTLFLNKHVQMYQQKIPCIRILHKSVTLYKQSDDLPIPAIYRNNLLTLLHFRIREETLFSMSTNQNLSRKRFSKFPGIDSRHTLLPAAALFKSVQYRFTRLIRKRRSNFHSVTVAARNKGYPSRGARPTGERHVPYSAWRPTTRRVFILRQANCYCKQAKSSQKSAAMEISCGLRYRVCATRRIIFPQEPAMDSIATFESGKPSTPFQGRPFKSDVTCENSLPGSLDSGIGTPRHHVQLFGVLVSA